MSLRRREFLQGGAAALAAPKRSPNLLFLFPDQLRPDWAGQHPDIPVHTPALDSLRKRGVEFTRAMVASPLCAPSRACLAAGKFYGRCGVPSNRFDYPLEQTTYYTLLRNAGYHVMGCGKLDLHKKTEDWGLDGKRLLKEWGFSDGIDNAGKWDAIRSGSVTPKDPYMGYLHQRDLAKVHVADFERRRKEGRKATFATPLPDEAYCDNWIAANGLQLLQSAPKDKPWHLVVNFTGPHDPVDITARMETGVRNRKLPQPAQATQLDATTHNAIRQNYTAMVENIDAWVGRFLKAVEQRGDADNTLVVFSSDHGDMLGDHDRWGKHVPHQPSAAVPLIVAGAGVKARGKTDALTSLIDVTATMLDYAGLKTRRDMDCQSLRPVLEGRARKHREVLYSGLEEWRLAWDGRYKLVRGFEKRPHLLFDLEADPHEATDIYREGHPAARRLSAALEVSGI